MANNDRPFTQYDDLISPTQEDNGDNGASERPVPDNGTKNAHFSVGGMPSVSKVDYPLPPDPNTPAGKDYAISDAEISDFGLNETVEVGHKGPIQNYGLVDGVVQQSGMDDSISGQGFGGASAGGGVDKNTKD